MPTALMTMTHAHQPPPPYAIPVDAFGLTDAGAVRPNNEDALLVRPDLGVFAVADGVGGGTAGEIASAMVVQSVCDAFENPDEITLPPEDDDPGVELGTALVVAGLRRAHRLIVAHRLSLGARMMASTFAGIAVSSAGVTVVHAGDSRVYRFRDGVLSLLTQDHSLVNELIQRGVLTPERAGTYPLSSIITRAVGAGREVGLEARLEILVPGDVYLLTSDGLHGVVDDDEVAAILIEHEDVTAAARALIDRANAKGGPDNITAVLVRLQTVVDA
jgi:PPM family protein phosphatase